MDGRIEIRSDNSGYKPLIVPADTVKIMGKVVWYGQNI
jgi:phage repressor protein C with HTH and peptisase S24 domain